MPETPNDRRDQLLSEPGTRLLDRLACPACVRDPEGRVLLANEPFARVIDVPLSEFLGRPFQELLADGPGRSAVEMDRRALAQGQVVHTEEALTIQGDAASRSFRVTRSPVLDEEGSAVAVLVLYAPVAGGYEAKGRIVPRDAEDLRLALEGARVGTWTLDLTSEGFSLDQESARILGMDGQEFGGTSSHHLSLVHPEDREAVVARLDRSVQEGHDFRSEHRVIRQDGRTIWVEGRGRVELAADGSPRWLRGTLQDITDRKAVEEELHRSRDLLQRRSDLFLKAEELAGVGAWEWNPGTQEVRWTEGMYRLRGLQPGEFEPTPEALWSDLTEASRSRVDEAVASILEAGGERDLHLEGSAPSGGSRWIRLCMRGTSTPTGGVRLSGVVVDLSPRQTERDLMARVAQGVSHAASGEFLEEAVRDLAATFRATEAFLGMLDESGDEPVIRTVTRISRGKPAPPVEYRLAGGPCEAVVGGRPVVIPERLREVFPGGDLPARVQAEGYAGAPVRSSTGRVVGLVAVLSPSPLEAPPSVEALLGIYAAQVGGELERRRVEEELHRKEIELLQAQKLEAVGKLAGGIAHDFNNLLTVINGYTDMILARVEGKGAHGDPQVRELALEIQRSGHRAATITRRLLSFSRSQAARSEPTELGPLLRGLIPTLEERWGEGGRVHLEAEDACWVEADPGQLEQVVLGLAEGVELGTGGPRILRIVCRTVLLGAGGDPGSNATEAEKKVELFIQVAEGTEAPDPQEVDPTMFVPAEDLDDGGALDLSHARGVVRHGGGILEVADPGDPGAIFRILLPATVPLPEAAIRETAHSEAGKARSGTVLLVEDDSAVRAYIRRILERQGYQVMEAADGFEAEVLAREADEPPDLLLVDVVMPGRSGEETATAVQEHCPEAKVLYISGYTDQVLAGQDEDRTTHFLQKPFSPDRLLDKMREVRGPPEDPQEPAA
jgi:two-component system, cell cycle sensor histidine kinase and response regulator CckA